MTRWVVARAAVVALVGLGVGTAFAADLPVDRYLNDPSLGTDGGGRGYYRPAPLYRPPAAPAPTYHAPVLAAPASAAPTAELPVSPRPVSLPPPAPAAATPSTGANAAVSDILWDMVMAVLLIMLACVLASLYRDVRRSSPSKFAAVATGGPEVRRGARPSGSVEQQSRAVAMPRGTVSAPEPAFPSQDGWARRAGTVRNPVSGVIFGVRARANARALEEEQKRMKSARGVIKEYAGMYEDLLKGEEAATAYTVRRELGGAHYDHERATQTEAFDEAAHRRQLAGKRRKKELTEADTRHLEAQHEQEATEKFKDAKFALGLARFEEKQKGHEVGSASANAAIAETKEPAQPSPDAGNESAEVMQLYRLLQGTMAAVEEGERLGRDTQALRERAALYKKLLNLA